MFDTALKNLGFFRFFKNLKNLKSPNLGFRFKKNKNLISDVSFQAFFTYHATNLIEMLSNFPINPPNLSSAAARH